MKLLSIRSKLFMVFLMLTIIFWIDKYTLISTVYGTISSVATEDVFIIPEISMHTVSIAIGLGALLLALLFSRSLSGPIIKLRDAAMEIGGGNLNVKIDINSGDEMGELARALKQMTRDLKKSREDKEKYYEELDLAVKKRTDELNSKLKDIEDSKAATLNMMEDVDQTNRELMETQNKLEESLEELRLMDAKKDEFISIAAHELKTPLTSIHGFSQLLLKKGITEDSEKRNNYLKIMDKETKRLAKLVTDILDLSRIDLGTTKITRENIDISEVMDTVKSEMANTAKEKGIKIEFHASGLPKSIPIDKEKLAQVLLNIVSNAIKYTDKGSISVGVSRKGEFIQFDVRDTGIGIPKEEHEKIFDRFYQVDSSYTRKSGGTGLGLALCKEYVEILGGKIWLESEPGKGSTFHFTIPSAGMPKDDPKKGDAESSGDVATSKESPAGTSRPNPGPS